VPIRLAIIGLPRLLSDLIAETFTADRAVRVDVLSDDGSDDFSEAIESSHEVVIVGVTDPWRLSVLSRISRMMRPRVFGVGTDGRESWVYRMQPCPQKLEPTSPAQIHAAVLSATDPGSREQ
jgi:hypothetical protein